MFILLIGITGKTLRNSITCVKNPFNASIEPRTLQERVPIILSCTKGLVHTGYSKFETAGMTHAVYTQDFFMLEPRTIYIKPSCFNVLLKVDHFLIRFLAYITNVFT